MSIEVALRVNEQGQLQIPDEIQQQLFPGMLVVLKLEEDDQSGNGSNGHAEVTPVTPAIPTGHTRAEVVEKDGWMVIRGELPPGFDWDVFLYEDRELRVNSLIDWAAR